MAERARLPLLPVAAAHVHPHDDAIERCAYCPKMCRFACPVAEADARETLTPWAKMGATFLASRGAIPLAAAFETSWACTGCGHCTEYCEHGNDVGAALAAVRAAGVAAGLPAPAADAVRVAYEKSGNPTGRSLAPALREIVPTSLRDDDAAIAFLPGCRTVADEPATVRAAMKVLEKLGTSGVGVPGDGACCGSELWWAGHPERFDDHAKRFAQSHGKRRAIVVADASCAWTLRELYPLRGHKMKAQVLHVSEWLAGFFRERVLKSRDKVKGAYLYHDPCWLARRLDVVDEPRAVLAAVLEDGPREFSWNRRDTQCCGAGGLLPRTLPDTAGRMARARADEAREAGASVVTSCPRCLHQLREGGAEAIDFLALVAKAL